jgi:hypothetical protein
MKKFAISLSTTLGLFLMAHSAYSMDAPPETDKSPTKIRNQSSTSSSDEERGESKLENTISTRTPWQTHLR